MARTATSALRVSRTTPVLRAHASGNCLRVPSPLRHHPARPRQLLKMRDGGVVQRQRMLKMEIWWTRLLQVWNIGAVHDLSSCTPPPPPSSFMRASASSFCSPDVSLHCSFHSQEHSGTKWQVRACQEPWYTASYVCPLGAQVGLGWPHVGISPFRTTRAYHNSPRPCGC